MNKIKEIENYLIEEIIRCEDNLNRIETIPEVEFTNKMYYKISTYKEILVKIQEINGNKEDKTYLECLEQSLKDNDELIEALIDLNEELNNSIKEIAKRLGLKKKFTIEDILVKIEVLRKITK